MSDTYVTDPEVLKQLNSSSTDYVKDEDLLKQLNAPTTGPSFGNKAAELGGQGLGLIHAVAEPVTNFVGEQIAQHPLASGGLASSYVSPLAQKVLPESVYNKIPGMSYLERLAETRRNLTNQVLGKGTPAGPVLSSTTTYPTTGTGVNIPINQPIAPGTAVTPGASMVPPEPPIGGPAAQQGTNFIQRIAQQYGSIAQKVAPVLQKAAPMVEGAGKLLGPAMMAKELFYTSPEERAILQRAEDERRAKGWKPINER